MNNAEKKFWGTEEAMEKYLRSVRFPDEELKRYDSGRSFEYAVMDMESIGEAGETVLAELMKMKVQAEKHRVAATPKAAVA